MGLKILIAPLDWGLGHATRCLPIIHYLVSENHQVIVAAEGNCRTLIERNFPNLEMIHLDGYGIRYSRYKSGFLFKIIRQIPQIYRSIRSEKRWLRRIQEKNQFDLVISDNRYGLFSKDVKSIILTHQLTIQTGFGSLVNLCLRKIHYHFLEKFNTCWIVDFPGEKGISGKLAHPRTIPSNSQYIGILSQFEIISPEEEKREDLEQIFILLSGPEPMRSVLEKRLLTQINQLPQFDFIFVAGKPEYNHPEKLGKNIQYYSFLPAKELKQIMENAKLVICRSGYSTIMDLKYLGKNALLIPTPGQTEQEYLANFIKKKGICYSVSQNRLNLHRDILKSFSFTGFIDEKENISPLYQIVLADLLKSFE